MNDIVLFGVEIPGNVFLGSLFVWLIATAANLKLFAKCDQPAWAVFVPGYNVVVAMRIIGRPDWHAVFFLVPVFNVYFAFRTMMELAASFGRRSTVDYLLVALFNVFYVLNLGLSYEAEYAGPVYGALKSSPAPNGSDARGGWAHA
jgi:hypothetical protein